MVAVQQKPEDQQEPPPLIADFGFNYPVEFVRRAVWMLESSNWVAWPDSGGWAEQDEALVDDVFTWLAVRRRLEWEVKNGFNSDYEELPDDLPPARRLEELI